MRRPRIAVTFGLLALVAIVASAGGAQEAAAAQPAGSTFRVLLVDETKTFSSTMRVGILAGVLKKSGIVELSVRLVDVESSGDDPLRAARVAEEKPFDLILIVPRGIDDGTIRQVWLVTRPLEELPVPFREGLALLSGVVDRVFAGVATAVDVTEDLYPGLFAALYVREGLL